MSPESLQYGETRLQACLKAARAQACQPILEAVLADVKGARPRGRTIRRHHPGRRTHTMKPLAP